MESRLASRLLPGRTAAALLSVALLAAFCSPDGSKARSTAAQADLGSDLFDRTQKYAALFGTNALACTNCHLEGGRKPGGLSLVGASRRYPESGPGGRTVTLEDRIARCFTHSLNGHAPAAASPEMIALAAYVTSLSAGATTPATVPGNTLSPANRIPLAQLSAEHGRAKFDEFCSGCHGLDGQGYRERRKPLPYDYVPPVWGPRSYNEVAGLARVYTLAGFVRHAMPWDQPGVGLTDEEAQEIAAFVDGQPRPVFADKDAWDGPSPADAVYDARRYPKNPFFVPLNQ